MSLKHRLFAISLALFPVSLFSQEEPVEPPQDESPSYFFVRHKIVDWDSSALKFAHQLLNSRIYNAGLSSGSVSTYLPDPGGYRVHSAGGADLGFSWGGASRGNLTLGVVSANSGNQTALLNSTVSSGSGSTATTTRQTQLFFYDPASMDRYTLSYDHEIYLLEGNAFLEGLGVRVGLVAQHDAVETARTSIRQGSISTSSTTLPFSGFAETSTLTNGQTTGTLLFGLVHRMQITDALATDFSADVRSGQGSGSHKLKGTTFITFGSITLPSEIKQERDLDLDVLGYGLGFGLTYKLNDTIALRFYYNDLSVKTTLTSVVSDNSTELSSAFLLSALSGSGSSTSTNAILAASLNDLGPIPPAAYDRMRSGGIEVQILF